MKLIESAKALTLRRSTAPKPAALLRAAIPYQSDLAIIVEELPPRFMRSTLYIVASLVVILVVIASVVKVDIVVVGTGQLITDSPTIVLQPLDRAIVRDLKVKPGDTVTKGEVLATLDPTFTQADMSSLTSRQLSLLAQVRRLEAELNGTPFVANATNNPDEVLEEKLYRDRQEQYASRLRTYDEDISHDEASVHSTEDSRASLSKQVDVAKDLEKMRSDLLATQSGSRLNYLDALSNRLRAERDYQDATNHLVELHHALLSKQAERQTFVDDWRRQLLEDLVKARADANNIDEGLAKAVLMHDLVIITAPQDGVVLDVANRSVGSVLQAAEPLITLVPADASLIANIAIKSSDIGYAAPGDDVAVKVDAFPYQRHGLLKGRLRSIGEESFSESAATAATTPVGANNGGSFHRAQVELTSTYLRDLPKGTRLIPGMTLSGEIEVGSRSIISYILYPLIRGLRESIHEP
jgi:HlyD family secretion protein